MKEIVFATNNEHKLSEVRNIIGHRFRVLSLQDIGCREELPETSDTLTGNALQKARYVNNIYGCNCFADDTGLAVEALGGAPGVYTARYAGPDCSPDDNIAKMLREMDGIENRKARFSTVIALIENGREHIFEGYVDGTIALSPQGTEGFGYDPIFIPDETGVRFSEMAADAKNAISHRGRAVAKLTDFLSNYYIKNTEK